VTFFRRKYPQERSEFENLERRNRVQQIQLEDSHRNNSRLRQVIAELTLTKSRRGRDVRLAEAEGKLDGYLNRS
jgi:hypothetical protein